MKLQKLNLSLLIYFGIKTQKTHIMEQNHQLWLKQSICHPVQKFIFDILLWKNELIKFNAWYFIYHKPILRGKLQAN